MPQKNSQNIVIEKLNILIQPLKNRHERHYKDSHFHFWADILLASTLVGLAITVLWLLVWQPKPDFMLGARLETSRVLSGQSEEFVIHYENEEGHPIGAVTLAVSLPDNFKFEAAEPAELFDAQTSTFLLGDLRSHDKGELRVRGIIRGEIEERQSLGLNLSYSHGQVKKQLLDSLVYHIDGSALETSLIEMPDTAYRTVAFNGAVEVKNNGRSAVETAAIVFPSTGWDITLQSGVLENGQLRIESLASGESRRFAFTALTEAEAGEYDFSVETRLGADSGSLLQSTISRSLSVVEPSVAVSAAFTESALAGNSARLNLSFENNDDAEISNLAFAIESRRESMAVIGVSSSTAGVSVSNNVLQYAPSLNPGANASLAATVALNRRSTLFNDVLDLSVNVSYEMNGEKYSYYIAAPKLRINSNLSVASGGYYYGPQGDQLGIGPVPPKVDIPTTYWIIWEANNLGNEVGAFEVSADLPANVVWVDQTSVVAGEISYSPIGRRVLWRVEKLEQTGGNYRVSFAVSLVPRQQDLGTIPALLSNIGFRGLDNYTGATISKSLPNITTNIESDRLSAGKGTVEALE